MYSSRKEGLNSQEKSYFCKTLAFDGRIWDLISSIWGWAAMEHMLWNAEQSFWPSIPAFCSLLFPGILPWAFGSQFVHKEPAFSSFPWQPQSHLSSKYGLGSVLSVWLKSVCVLTRTLFLRNPFTGTCQTHLKVSATGITYLPFHTGTAKKRHIFTGIARSEPIQVKWCNLLVLAVLFSSLLHHSLPSQLNLCFDHL